MKHEVRENIGVQDKEGTARWAHALNYRDIMARQWGYRTLSTILSPLFIS